MIKLFKSGNSFYKPAPAFKLMVAAALLVAGSALYTRLASAESAHLMPAPVVDEHVVRPTLETAVFAGGCFWGVQGVFQHVKGITNAVSGYAGGTKRTADYDAVSTGATGHAESVQITFDPSTVSYGHLLQIYFSVAHDPTELNHQGPDDGTQYRSAIFPTSAEQSRIAKAYINQISKAHVFHKAVVTTLEPGKIFYPAEAHHQNFLTLNPDYPYIVVNDLPKVRDLKRLFPADYRAAPVLVADNTAMR